MPRSLYFDLSLKPDTRSIAAFELCVLNPQAEVDLEPGHALGNRFLAMVNVAEFRATTFQGVLAAKRRIKTSRGEEKGTAIADPADPKWLAWAVNGTADAAAKRGFDGFVIGIGNQMTNRRWQTGALEMVQVLKNRYPDKQILLDANLGIGPQAAGLADGLLAIGVHTSRGKRDTVELRPPEDANRLVALLRQAHSAGMRLFGVEFSQPHDVKAACDASARLQSIGVLPFITTPEARGVNLGPLQEMTRQVLVLHGWDAKYVGEAAPSAHDTLTARFLHAPLEWLGCQVEYLTMDAEAKLPPPERYRGIVFDSGMILGAVQQQRLAEWALSLRDKKVPLLVTGMPWTEPHVIQQMRDHLSLGGSCEPAPKLVKTGIACIDNTSIRAGARVSAPMVGFLDLQAPESAHVVLSARGQDTLGTEHRFDQAFHASWGSAWIEPAALSCGPQVDLYHFASRWLQQTDPVPAIDTTTRDGRRVFFSHISSEGFTRASSLPGFPLCSDIMRKRILGRYLLPFTVAICEADVRGWRPGQNPADAPRHEQIARSIFELPNVAAASNSFSLPTRWEANEKIAGPLNQHAHSERLDMEREVAGSMSYIHRRLLPEGKNVSMMLWPESARPTSEALAFCASMGVQSITPMQHDSKVAPLEAAAGQFATGRHHGVQIEVFSTEKPAAKHKVGPAERLACLQLSEVTRRETPVAVGASFLDVQTPAKLAAFEKLLNWCVAQPLRAMPAALYAASVRDAIGTRIIRMADRHWMVLNEGHARTVRLPASIGVPDLSRCRGISGYKLDGDQLYIHTLGRPRSEIVLTDVEQARSGVHLVECSSHIEFLELATRRATFMVHDWRPVEVVLGGFEPHGTCAYKENGRPYNATADDKGVVRLELSRQATVTLQSLPPANTTASN